MSTVDHAAAARDYLNDYVEVSSDRVLGDGPDPDAEMALAAAQVHATLALVEVVREALADDVAESRQEAPEPPAPHADASLWQEVTADTAWAEGDLARSVPFDDSGVGIVYGVSRDSFLSTVLKVRLVLDPHEDRDDEDLPTAVWIVERNDLAIWRRKPKAVQS